jgi:hypothetical protein
MQTIYPSAYGLSFYTAESFKSNEVRDFTNWVAVPPHTIDVVTHPKDIVIRQGEEQLIPSEIETPLSNNVTTKVSVCMSNRVQTRFKPDSNGKWKGVELYKRSIWYPTLAAKFSSRYII